MCPEIFSQNKKKHITPKTPPTNAQLSPMTAPVSDSENEQRHYNK